MKRISATWALVIVAILGAGRLEAQQATPRPFMQEFLFIDADNNGTESCGDTLNYVASITSDPNNVVDEQGVRFSMNYDPNLAVIAGTVLVDNATPDGTRTIVSGNSAGDRSLVVDLGHVQETLPKGPDGATIQVRFKIQGPSMGTTISMQGTFTGTNFAPALTPVVSRSFIPCAPTGTPDLAMQKRALVSSVAPGGSLAYNLSISNVGTAGVASAVLQETVPANTTFDAAGSDAGWSCSPNGNAGASCTETVGPVAAGGSSNATFAVKVSNPLPAGVSSINNVACVSASGDMNPLNNCSSVNTPTTGAPDLMVTKTAGSGMVSPGGSLVYTLAYKNLGNQDAAGVSLTETVPANTTFSAAGSTAGWSCSPNGNAGSSCTLAVGTVAAGASGSATYAVTVAATLPAGVSSIGNVACTSAAGDPNTGNNCSSVTTPTNASPDLMVTKTAGSGTVAPGGTLVYTLAYKNVGSQGASGVSLTETVPANTTFSAAGSTAGWSCSPSGNAGSSCTLAVGTVAAGASGSATYAVTVAATLPAGVSSIGNVACTSAAGDPNTGNNCSSVTTPTTGAPDLMVTKTAGSGTVAPGGTLVYTLAYKNLGNQDAVGVSLTETVPANTTFSAAGSTAGWSCAPDGNAGSSCTLAVGSVAAGAGGSASYAVTVAATLPAGVSSIGNFACASGPGDSNAGNNCSTVTTPTSGAPDLRLSKTADVATFTPGGRIVYTLAFKNLGNQDAGGVSLTETVPANTTFSAAGSTAGWSCAPDGNAGSSCTLAVGTVAAGAGGSVTYAVTVAANLPPDVAAIDNTACEQAATGGLRASVTCSMVSTPKQGAADLALTKTPNSASVAPGEGLIYTLLYKNVGGGTATAVDLQETVPANAVFDAATSSPGWSCSPNGESGASCHLALPDVAPGGGGTVIFAVRAKSPLGAGASTIDNTACIRSVGDPNPANDCGSASTPTTVGPPPPADIPTLGQWGMFALALALCGAGLGALKGNKAQLF